jgi:aryl-alcohol dehydrogenase-like predicted oxidoreductase
MYTDRYWNAELFAGIEALTDIAERAGLPLSALALRWLLGQDRVSSLLLGGSKISHLQANLAVAAQGPLPDDVIKACDEVGQRLRGPMPAYNR